MRGRTLATVDDWALRALARLYVDVAFIGTNGFSVERGLPPRSRRGGGEAGMIAAARRTVVLADHTKIGNDYLARFGDAVRGGRADHRHRAGRPDWSPSSRPPGPRVIRA